MEMTFSIAALIVSVVAIVISIAQYRKSENAAKAEAAAREAWMLEQIARWRRGELTAKQEACITGGADVLVIEPEPGHRIVVGTVGRGKSGLQTN